MIEEELIRKFNMLEDEITELKTGKRQRWIMLQAPLISTSWDGDSFSSVAGGTLLDLSVIFGAPANIKEILLMVRVNDSAALGTPYLHFSCGPSVTEYHALMCITPGGDVTMQYTQPCPCSPNGDIYYEINASGAGTMDVVLQIWGYLI